MRFLMALVLLAGTAGWASGAQAACDGVKGGWVADNFQISTTELLTLSDVGLAAYIMGYSQGVLISVLAGTDKACIDALHQCTRNHTLGELAYQLRRYVADRPELGAHLASEVTFDAIFGPCFESVDD